MWVLKQNSESTLGAVSLLMAICGGVGFICCSEDHQRVNLDIAVPDAGYISD